VLPVVIIMLLKFLCQRCSTSDSNYRTAWLQTAEGKDWTESSEAMEVDAIHKPCTKSKLLHRCIVNCWLLAFNNFDVIGGHQTSLLNAMYVTGISAVLCLFAVDIYPLDCTAVEMLAVTLLLKTGFIELSCILT